MLLQADARALPLADASVQMVCTSPPYWGLRDYGLPPSVWDGDDPACAHVWGDEGRSAQRLRNGQGSNTVAPVACPVTLHPATGAFCADCGAWRGVLGLEPTPELYVAHIVEVFREVRRVLRPDGVVWLNLADSYYSATATQGRNESRSTISSLTGHGSNGRSPALDAQISTSYARAVGGGLKPKDLVGIPWRVAFALQADGWTLRADVIWAKPNPMPESVTDRPTKAHEYLFLLAKAERYYYDGDAIKETAAEASAARYRAPFFIGTKHESGGFADLNGKPHSAGHKPFDGTRNRCSVWTIATEPYPEAHFATFPEALVVPCVLAGSRVGDVVLDPFGGTATVGAVAERLGRRWVATDLKPEYLALARRRTAQRGLPFLATLAAG